MSRLPIPNPNASIVSLTSPFTRRSLRTIKDALSAAYTTKYSIDPTETHAAVLVPLCNLNGNPGLLLEVRGKLRSHSGEVRWAPFCFAFVDFHPSWSSFPGGKVDPTDESVLHAALRETKEEVGIDVDNIEILGRLGPPTRSLSGLRVWPYVVSFKCYIRPFRQVTSVKAFLHEKPYGSAPDIDDASPLPSPPLSSLTLSQVEVAAAFHLPLNRFTDPRFLREHRFSGLIPYWACDVTDLVAPGIEWSDAGGDSGDEVGGGFGGRLEIWGLTGWYLNLFMNVFLGGRWQ